MIYSFHASCRVGRARSRVVTLPEVGLILNEGKVLIERECAMWHEGSRMRVDIAADASCCQRDDYEVSLDFKNDIFLDQMDAPQHEEQPRQAQSAPYYVHGLDGSVSTSNSCYLHRWI